jgi:Flp pilus assembly pilin Flp
MLARLNGRRRGRAQAMHTQLDLLGERIGNEQGAEIVEWVLWVGGIAVLASAMYTVLSGALTTVATNIIAGMGSISGT